MVGSARDLQTPNFAGFEEDEGAIGVFAGLYEGVCVGDFARILSLFFVDFGAIRIAFGEIAPSRLRNEEYFVVFLIFVLHPSE
ncbi:hypothetical protein R1sor_005023 [Riccia sorocarpa]|uniref:Uncharacterized protein n=1 Tax=Riccia sorocarpa TaxID=122646 RepID=A0ABD3HLB1_9MARC